MALVHDDGRDREIERETEWFWHLPDLGVTLKMGPKKKPQRNRKPPPPKTPK
ncbi:hypothetical protein TorRG33x02_319300 [Trema orientale]|uniref:Uncharacterized protein n=1 Tax=Trema orientale TaxID=63057 RepID=A0A2P5BJ80_TREOI|nr:hypothetical protein TorRG33x02_319300 [Trema orientale]